MGRGMDDAEKPDAPAVVPAVRSVTPLSGCDAAFLTRHARRILPYASRTPHSLRDTRTPHSLRVTRRIPYARHAIARPADLDAEAGAEGGGSPARAGARTRHT